MLLFVWRVNQRLVSRDWGLDFVVKQRSAPTHRIVICGWVRFLYRATASGTPPHTTPYRHVGRVLSPADANWTGAVTQFCGMGSDHPLQFRSTPVHVDLDRHVRGGRPHAHANNWYLAMHCCGTSQQHETCHASVVLCTASDLAARVSASCPLSRPHCAHSCLRQGCGCTAPHSPHTDPVGPPQCSRVFASAHRGCHCCCTCTHATCA